MDPDEDYTPPEDDDSDSVGGGVEIIADEKITTSRSGLLERGSPGLDDLEIPEPNLKRASPGYSEPPPFKRRRGDFHRDYLDLLNRDVEDASSQALLEDPTGLPDSQIGLTSWSAAEKAAFFEALSRLGQGNVSQIAARIRTKNEIEVFQYLTFLKEAVGARTAGRKLHSPVLAEMPAAAELGVRCCIALEEVADAISVRQERHEEQLEEMRWGELWNVTRGVARSLDSKSSPPASRQPPFVGLFRLQQWQKLSERMFMNASFPENNWRFVDDRPPSIWATTLEDFYSLALSFTRRLVHATLFIAQSKDRAKRATDARMKYRVRLRDVEAAVASLGVPRNSKIFWAKCARRLRLHVYDDDACSSERETDAQALEDGGDVTNGEHVDDGPLPYEEIEAILMPRGGPDTRTNDEVTTEDSSDDGSSTESAEGDGRTDDSSDNGSEDGSEDGGKKGRTDADQDAREALLYSATILPQTRGARRTLESRIRAEIIQEEHAEWRDQNQSTQAELDLWRLLGKQPPRELLEKRNAGPEAGEPRTRESRTVGEFFIIDRDWRFGTGIREEWEAGDVDGDHHM